MIFGFGAQSIAITGQPVFINTWEAQHVAGNFSSYLKGPGGGGGGTNPLGGKTGGGGGDGQEISSTIFLYSPGQSGGSVGSGGAEGFSFDPGQPGSNGESLYLTSGGTVVFGANGGSGGAASGASLPNQNPAPFGNGGWGGGGWSLAGTVQNRGQSGSAGYVTLTRLS